MRYLSLAEVLSIYRRIIAHTGGSLGVRDFNALESALAQPGATYGGDDLCPTLIDKASALGFCLIQNHPFIDGNKRVGHASMETFLVLNGFEINALIEKQEQIILTIASGNMKRDDFAVWLRAQVVERSVP